MIASLLLYNIKSMNTKTDSFFSKLKPLFARLPIDIVYLYGSLAEKKNDKLSDVDFGVLFSKSLSPKKRFHLRLQLFGDIGRCLQIAEENIDVVDFKEIPVLLQFNIISGKVIYCRNEKRRMLFETYVMSRYHDEHYYYDKYLSDTLEKLQKGVYFERQIPYA